MTRAGFQDQPISTWLSFATSPLERACYSRRHSAGADLRHSALYVPEQARTARLFANKTKWVIDRCERNGPTRTEESSASNACADLRVCFLYRGSVAVNAFISRITSTSFER